MRDKLRAQIKEAEALLEKQQADLKAEPDNYAYQLCVVSMQAHVDELKRIESGEYVKDAIKAAEERQRELDG